MRLKSSPETKTYSRDITINTTNSCSKIFVLFFRWYTHVRPSDTSTRNMILWEYTRNKLSIHPTWASYIDSVYLTIHVYVISNCCIRSNSAKVTKGKMTRLCQGASAPSLMVSLDDSQARRGPAKEVWSSCHFIIGPHQSDCCEQLGDIRETWLSSKWPFSTPWFPYSVERLGREQQSTPHLRKLYITYTYWY